MKHKIALGCILIGSLIIPTSADLRRGFSEERQTAQMNPAKDAQAPSSDQFPNAKSVRPEPNYEVKEFRERVPMRDGIELAVKIIRPAASGRFPAIVSYGPYHMLERPPEKWETVNQWIGGAANPAIPADPLQYYAYFAQRGYAMVEFDARGTDNSGGYTTDMYSDPERQDGYDMVEWIASQPWSNGNVGMWGISYGGVDTWQVAMLHPPHLKAIIVRSGTDDIYTDWAYPGGMPRGFYLYGYYLAYSTAQNFAPPNIEYTGAKWADIWQEHLDHNVPSSIVYLQHQLDGPYWRARSLRPDYDRVKCPVFVIGGWADYYSTALLRAFSHLRVPKKALIGPWAHFWPENALPGPRIDARGLYLRWFDQWLKGTETGIMSEPPITLFVTQYQPPAPVYIETKGFWRQENEWPLARAESTPMYLRAEGKLSEEPNTNPNDEHDEYTYDPTVGVMDGMYGRGATVPWVWAMPLDQRLDEAKSLTYTSPPLKKDTEVTGEPKADLFVSSSAEVAYFVAKVCDVSPDGVSKLVTYAGLNATHRTSDVNPEPLKPGEVYELKIDLEYLAYVFPAGHRIRVDIASADFQNAWPVSMPAVNSIYHSSRYPSRVVLPITPEQNPKLPPPQLPPSPNSLPKLQTIRKPDYGVTYNLIDQTAMVSVKSGTSQETFTVSKNDPAVALAVGNQEFDYNDHGLVVKLHVHAVTSSDATTFRHLEELDITLDDKPYFHKNWTIAVPRLFN